MLSFKSFITENIQIGMSKKAFATLSYRAQSAIRSWESSNWHGGPLEKSVIANDEIAQEIEAAFAPIRAKLPNPITLYRGIQKQEHYTAWQNAVMMSWTDDKRVAEHFAGLRNYKIGHNNGSWKSHIQPVRSDAEIDKMVAQFMKTGFLKIGRMRYVRSKTNPQYFDIWSGNEYQTDGDMKDFKRDLLDSESWREEANQEKLDRAVVITEKIDTSRIVWLTNSLNSKEYIVKVKK